MIDKVKAALRLTVNNYDEELAALIKAAVGDLRLVGIDLASVNTNDPLVIMAVITYCRMHFGSPEDFDRLKRSYDEQKAQLMTASGYGLPGGLT